MVWTPSTDPQPDTPDAPNYGQYVVREGDTYWGIAHDAGIDVSTLIELNHLADTSRLDVGQVLNVPVAQGEADDVATSSDALSVVVALDNTGSMMGAPFQQQLQAVRQLVTGLGSAQVALVTYSDEAEVALSLTSDRTAFAMSMGLLVAGGDSALYDGAQLAISEAARATSDHAVVILLTDGGETAGLSDAETDEAARIAWANAIPVVGVAIGPDANTDYLTTLAEAAGGKVYTIATASELTDTVTAILADIAGGTYATSTPASIDRAGIPSMESAAAETSRNELAASLLSPTLADSSLAQVFIQALGGGGNAPLLPVPGMNAGSVSGSQTSNPVAIERIPPLLDGLSQLNIVNENDAIDIPVVTTNLEPETAGAVAEDAAVGPITRIDAESIAESLTSNVAAITIDVAAGTDVQVAELALNGYRLQTFEQEPYTYELDTTMLDAGHYNLTFTVANEGDVMSAGTFEFEVAVRDAVPAAVVAENDADELDQPAVAGPGMRVLMVDGEPTDLNLTFSTAGGLALVEPEVEALVAPEESLLDILTQPTNNLIPPAVREALTTPRPLASALIILTMTLTLLPQGLFTLYWLMYAWNNPKTIEDSQSPREFVAPEISFTALLPARHEEAVIKDTIFAVDRINYPEHLKEVLILCRDDDQGTIAKANEAVAELGKPNIRVVTFSTGPINKPHSLNIGLGEATNDVVAVFDAEDEPHTNIYNVINTVMQRDDADVVQSGVQLMNFRSNWFSALNVLEYFFWFKSGLHCFTRQFQVTPLGGNTVFFKREMLKQIDGWDETCLTEDADVGIRLTLLGANIQIVYDAEHATREETPDTVESFIKQRTRWNQGFYQVFFKGDWAKLPTMKQRITALYILLNSVMQAAILLFLPVGLYIALTQQVAVPIAIISYIPIYLLLMQLLTNLIGIREFAEAYGERLPLGFRLRMIVAYYPYQLLLAVAAGRAIMRQMSQKQTWEKTSHSNLHRQGQVLGRA